MLEATGCHARAEVGVYFATGNSPQTRASTLKSGARGEVGVGRIQNRDGRLFRKHRTLGGHRHGGRRRVVVWCGEELCGVVWCGVVWCGVVWCSVVVVVVVVCGWLAGWLAGWLVPEPLFDDKIPPNHYKN